MKALSNLMSSIGGLFKNLLGKLFSKTPARIVMVGLDAAGKTTILGQLTINEKLDTVPTIGFQLQSVKQGKLQLDIYDIGGQESLRHLWEHYYRDSDAIIFVVDSADLERKQPACDELQKALKNPELSGVPLLVFANKQDLPNAASKEEVAVFLQIHEIDPSQRDWYVQKCSAITKEGIIEGFSWLQEAVERWQKGGKKAKK